MLDQFTKLLDKYKDDHVNPAMLLGPLSDEVHSTIEQMGQEGQRRLIYYLPPPPIKSSGGGDMPESIGK